MGYFEWIPFLFGVLIPGICMMGVVVLAMTPWRSSALQLVLSFVTLAYGILYASVIGRSSGFSPLLALYGLPTLWGGLGVLVWLRARRRG